MKEARDVLAVMELKLKEAHRGNEMLRGDVLDLKIISARQSLC